MDIEIILLRMNGHMEHFAIRKISLAQRAIKD